MATLFFSRNGKDPSRAENKGELTIEKVMQFFKNQDLYYFPTPPLINPEDNPSPYSGYTNVVIEIGNSEVNEKFTKSGFYYFPKVQPSDCKELINLREL
jgi:hypothetical protein